MNGKSLSNTEYTMIREDGSTFPALVNSNPVLKDDKPVGLRGIIVDITERKRAENKIKESQQRLSSHINNTPLGSIFWDTDFKVIEWNSSAEQIFGYNKEEALGRHPYSLIVPREIQGQIDNVFSQLLTQTGGSRSVNENVTKDGKRILCDWYNVAITDLNGNVTGVASLVDDITEQKETERKLKESRNQLRSLAERLQMIREEERSVVSREIHDDLGQVLTALKMDISSLQNKSNIELSELIDRTDKMLELVNSSIQTVKRIATELRPGILDDLGLFSAIEWQVEEFQNRAKINCHLDIEGEIDFIDDEVSIAVFRIFQETLTNITRHSHATQTEIKILCSDNDLMMDVEDNGKGISIEALNSSMSLGIIGMRERVNILRGEFEIFGDPGKGTKVHIKIPLRKKEIV
jgi:PAS domain S-box-containing protein